MYDPMIAKLIVWDNDRAAATKRMLRALTEYEITGLATLLPFHRALLTTEQWRRGETCRDLLESVEWLAGTAAETGGGAEARAESTLTRDYTVEVSGRRFAVKVSGAPSAAGSSNGASPARVERTQRERTKSGGPAGDVLTSPMQGTILKIAVEPGAAVEEGELVAIIEAMKMENEITAHKSGTVRELPIAVGGAVGAGDPLAVISSNE
jgi:acetyl-CoA/propionyl-CoA carboxylase biotin carboxyl carrier protein